MKNMKKKNTLLLALLSLISLMILFQGCDNGGGGNGNGDGNVIVITEDINSHTTWETGKIYPNITSYTPKLQVC